MSTKSCGKSPSDLVMGLADTVKLFHILRCMRRASAFVRSGSDLGEARDELDQVWGRIPRMTLAEKLPHLMPLDATGQWKTECRGKQARIRKSSPAHCCSG